MRNGWQASAPTFPGRSAQERLVGDLLSQFLPSHVAQRFRFVLVVGEREVLEDVRDVAQRLRWLLRRRGAHRRADI